MMTDFTFPLYALLLANFLALPENAQGFGEVLGPTDRCKRANAMSRASRE